MTSECIHNNFIGIIFNENNNKIPVPYPAHLEVFQIFMNYILIDKHSIDQVDV